MQVSIPFDSLHCNVLSPVSRNQHGRLVTTGRRLCVKTRATMECKLVETRSVQNNELCVLSEKPCTQANVRLRCQTMERAASRLIGCTPCATALPRVVV